MPYIYLLVPYFAWYYPKWVSKVFSFVSCRNLKNKRRKYFLLPSTVCWFLVHSIVSFSFHLKSNPCSRDLITLCISTSRFSAEHQTVDCLAVYSSSRVFHRQRAIMGLGRYVLISYSPFQSFHSSHFLAFTLSSKKKKNPFESSVRITLVECKLTRDVHRGENANFSSKAEHKLTETKPVRIIERAQ